jgi:predicted esterase
MKRWLMRRRPCYPAVLGPPWAWTAFVAAALSFLGSAAAEPPPVRSESEQAALFHGLAVPDDRGAFVVDGPATSERTFVYLHGRCGDPLAGIRAFGEVTARLGTMISVVGDVPCPDRPGRTKWSADVAAIQRRIERAIAAAGDARGARLSSTNLTVFGYSEGALRAESLASKFPQSYPRVVLLASPRAPAADRLAGAKVVALVEAGKDPSDTMREGARALARSTVPSKLFVLPGAKHGQYGPEGERVMTEVLSFLSSVAP